MPTLLNTPDWKLLLSEALKRMRERSPKFFRVWQNVNWIIAAIGLIPAVLSEFNVILPPNWVVVVSKIVAFAGTWGAIMAKLPVSQPTKEVMEFTEKKNIEQEIKKEADNFQPPSSNNNKTSL